MIDLHQDILLHERDPDAYKYKDQTSLERVVSSGIKLVFGTGFVFGKSPVDDGAGGVKSTVNVFDPACMDMIEADIDQYVRFEENSVRNVGSVTENGDEGKNAGEVRKVGDFRIIRNRSDFDALDASKSSIATGLIIHIEGLNTFEDTAKCWSRLETFYDKGLRSIGMTWSKANSLGGGDEDPDQGLTDLGKKLITWANDRGVLIDCAHMSEKSFFDVAACTKAPLFVSHGNARALCDIPRNYSDEQLRRIGESGGLIGVFFANSCLVPQGMSTIDDVVRHIAHISDLIGIDYVAIGSDLGGLVLNIPEGLRRVEDLGNLAAALADKGFTHGEISKIFYQNAAAFLRKFLSEGQE